MSTTQLASRNLVFRLRVALEIETKASHLGTYFVRMNTTRRRRRASPFQSTMDITFLPTLKKSIDVYFKKVLEHPVAFVPNVANEFPTAAHSISICAEAPQ